MLFYYLPLLINMVAEARKRPTLYPSKEKITSDNCKEIQHKNLVPAMKKWIINAKGKRILKDEEQLKTVHRAI